MALTQEKIYTVEDLCRILILFWRVGKWENKL